MLQHLTSLPFADSFIPIVFGLAEVTLIGGMTGYMTGALCVAVQALFPWALPASALGAIAALLLGSHSPGALPRSEMLYPYMGAAALAGHAASLVVGPLRGRISIVREGVMVAAMAGLLSSKPMNAVILVGIVLAVAQRFGGGAPDAATTGGGTSSTAVTPILAMWSNVSTLATALISWIFRFKTLAWGFGGIILGAFFDYPGGGVVLWFLLFSILGYQSAWRARWTTAGARAQAARAAGDASGP